jgi:hypothetical protein
MRRCSLLWLAALVLSLAAVAPARSAGVHDGVYFATLSHRTAGDFAMVIVVLQNGDRVLLLNLFPDETWTYGLGRITGNAASGDLQTLSPPLIYATFSVTFDDGEIAGTARFVTSGLTFSVSGKRVW